MVSIHSTILFVSLWGERDRCEPASHELHVSVCSHASGARHTYTNAMQCPTPKVLIVTKHSFGGDLPTVPLPPIGIIPKRLNGTEKVTTLGVISRITMTSAGLAGISLFDMLLLLLSAFEDDVEKGL